MKKKKARKKKRKKILFSGFPLATRVKNTQLWSKVCRRGNNAPQTEISGPVHALSHLLHVCTCMRMLKRTSVALHQSQVIPQRLEGISHRNESQQHKSSKKGSEERIQLGENVLPWRTCRVCFIMDHLSPTPDALSGLIHPFVNPCAESRYRNTGTTLVCRTERQELTRAHSAASGWVGTYTHPVPPIKHTSVPSLDTTDNGLLVCEQVSFN